MNSKRAKNNDPSYIGQKFGRLTVVGFGERKLSSGASCVTWDCQCECGNMAYGKLPKSVKRHMRKRCNLPTVPAYPKYGGRGIRVCDEWEDFQNFYDWAISHGYADDLTIERIDVNGNYEPSNCEWITLGKQTWNKRDTIRVEMENGDVVPLKEACRRLGLPYKAVHLRITRYGMTLHEALTRPF